MASFLSHHYRLIVRLVGGIFCKHRREKNGWLRYVVSQVPKCAGPVARAKGMAQIAGQTGLSREQLYRSFSEKGNPTQKTTLAVMNALGVQLTAKIPNAA
jgi:transcriptional regulator with XRE-family HTH domain